MEGDTTLVRLMVSSIAKLIKVSSSTFGGDFNGHHPENCNWFYVELGIHGDIEAIIKKMCNTESLAQPVDLTRPAVATTGLCSKHQVRET